MYTQGIENLNGRIRHYLVARFHRKDKCYSKSIEMMIASSCYFIEIYCLLFLNSIKFYLKVLDKHQEIEYYKVH
ncbi:MAG: hypothetical protein ACI9CD_001004 [Candidatus Deianiraeaceae bacterium]|jgi:hypothetical protein